MNQNHEIPSEYNEALEIDNKIVKKHYPRTNNDQVLEFVFERDPNLYLRKNKILIKGAIEVPDSFVPDTGFVAKLFSMLTVEVDSHAISSNRAKYELLLRLIIVIFFRGEYFLIDYLQKYGNFNCNAISSMFQVEGYHDIYNFDYDKLNLHSKTIDNRKQQGKLANDNRIYDFIFIPNNGFLNSNLPLLNNCEVKLSFDRCPANTAFLGSSTVIDEIKNVIAIKDCYAITEYVSSDSLRNHFAKIDSGPVRYKFEECEVTLKNIPLNETQIRLDNIKGGNNPLCLFAGIIKTSAINGDQALSATGFRVCGVQRINITLNGNSVNGYPLEISNESPVLPMRLFNDVTNRYMNPLAGDCVDINRFKSNWLYAHSFEAEVTSQGWIGMSLNLEDAFVEPHTLIIWTVSKSSIEIDKFHQIEKLVL